MDLLELQVAQCSNGSIPARNCSYVLLWEAICDWLFVLSGRGFTQFALLKYFDSRQNHNRIGPLHSYGPSPKHTSGAL